MTIDQALSMAIRAERYRAGLTADQVADRYYDANKRLIPAQRIYEWERPSREARRRSLWLVEEIAAAFNLSASELVRRAEIIMHGRVANVETV